MRNDRFENFNRQRDIAGTFTAKHIDIARNAYVCPLRKFGDVDNHLASS